MTFGRSDVLEAFSTYDIVNLPWVSQGRPVVKA